ncbi:MAG: ABC transporter permease subunit [Chloroflexi bacterium]|nr:ABC transporter permease subunit [Chloroflexota bacterium]
MAETVAARAPVKLAQQPAKQRYFWQDALRHILHDRLTLIALIGLIILTLACIVGPVIVENVLHIDVNRTNIAQRYQYPGAAHILGTDNLGRDQFLRLLYGGQVSLAIAYFASILSIVIGVTVGTIAGFYGRWVDDILIWLINTLESIPTIFILLTASTIWSPSPTVLIVLLSALGWVQTCRLVRGEVISLRERDYILAARALGAPNRRLMLQHILPNVLSTVIVSLTISAGVLILIESGLSFLGLGVQPPTPSWGNMLTDARTYFARGTYLVIWPGVLIALTVLFFYILGDGLRDALDPRARK